MKFYKYLIQNSNDEPDYGVATEAELIAKLRKIAEDTAAHKCRSLPPELVEAFDSGSMERTEYEFSNWMTEPAPYSDDYCLPPDGVTVSWEPEPRVQAFVDSLDAALTEADEMKSEGFPEPGWGPEARAAFAVCAVSEADKSELARLERAIYESGVDGGEATSDAIEALKSKEEALGLSGLTDSPRWN